MSTKKTMIVSILIVMLMTSTAFAGNNYTTKKTDKRIIEEITNSFFIEKEEAFLSNEDLDITKYYNTNDVKKIKNDSSFNLFEYEKQMRNENNSNI